MLLLLLQLLLVRGRLAVAAGDEYNGCEVPDYPVNIKVLLDTWKYQTLLAQDDATINSTVWTTINTAGSRYSVVSDKYTRDI